MKLVPTVRTTPSMRDFARALLATWTDASKAAAGVLYAQFAGETGRGHHCYSWNLGNVKWTAGCGWDYQALNGVWEGKPPAEAERLIASGQWRADPSADHAKAVGPGKVSVIALPSNPASWFRAYPSLDVGMRVYVKGKQPDPTLPPEKQPRYASAWPYALAGDCDGYARELGRRGYYTASPDAYSKALLVHHREWMSSKAFDEVSGSSAPPTPIPAGACMRVTASTLNVRSSASTAAPIVATLRAGTVVEVARESDRDWVEVHVGVAVAGWISTAYVEFVESEPDARALPTVDVVTGETWVLPFAIVYAMPDTQALHCRKCTLMSCAGNCT